VELLANDDSARATVLRAEALEQLGRVNEAAAGLQPWRDRLQDETIEDAAELTAAAKALVMLARLQGRPAQDYHLAMQLFARARDDLDRFYWPAHLAEAHLLLEKDNRPDAARAAFAALRLNPRSSEAWHLLGSMAIDGFDFDRATTCIDRLRQINNDHLLADILEASSYLRQKAPSEARQVLEPLIARFPRQRQLLALLAATESLTYDEEATRAALQHYDSLSPNSPLAYFTVGEHLSAARQYQAAEQALRVAIDRSPNWPAPRVELGLLLMQGGEEEKARAELTHAARLDPFNTRANNQLQLVEELLGYEQIVTDHFIIKYRKGIDAVLARDMPQPLERIHREVTGVFEHRPGRRTRIEIMPDEKWFGVRITGMPEIWTIAACTGDVIALVPPRDGPRLRGTFDWVNVIRHEFVHTVTLDQTANRIPHWFTEACAVSQELTGRDYATCQLLATALQEDRLFELDQITWGFVRPKTPQDRPLAYAQSHWMLQYITATYGHRAVVQMLRMYRQGAGDIEALTAATDTSTDVFMTRFKQWAQQQTKRWGLGPQPHDPRIATLLATQTNDEATLLNDLLAEYPDHPDLLRLAAERAVSRADDQAAYRAVLRYAAARPVDPWSHKQLVELAARTGRPQEVIGSLEHLDRHDPTQGRWAYQLAQTYRSSGQLDQAAQAAERALQREPYNATYRELAAAIDLQRNDMDAAVRHVKAMAVLEPDRAIHQVRLAALYHKMSRHEDAHHAAENALQIDPEAPVQRYMQAP
ncbi:MAG: tetratricopeptide repeat protein, partial [Phycisphaeraceae bacterium]